MITSKKKPVSPGRWWPLAVLAVLIILAWPSPAEFAEGDAAMDVLSAILANGKSSRLHQALVYGRPVAQDVYAGQWSRRLGSQFVVWATARAGTDADALEAALREALAAAIERLDEDDVQRAVRAFERTFVTGLESVSDRAAQLNAYLAAPGDPDYVARDLARYQGLNAARVREVAQAVLRPGAGATLRVLPEASR